VATIREQIVERVVAAIAGGSPPVGLTVHRERTRPIELDDLPAVVVKDAKESKPRPIQSNYKAPFVEREISIVLEFRAKGSSGVSPDQAIDPLYAYAMVQIFKDESFGGLANGVEEGETEWRAKEGDTLLAASTTHLSIKYRTSRIDPSSRT
jgi:hypothetical protein